MPVLDAKSPYIYIMAWVQHGITWTGRVLVGGLFLAFLVGYSSAYLSPATFWWTGPFASLLPWIAGVSCLVAAGLGVWAGRKRQDQVQLLL